MLSQRSEVRALAAGPVFVLAFVTAVAVRYGELPGPSGAARLWTLAAMAVAIKTSVFWWKGVFRIRGRHLGFDDLLKIARAAGISSILFGAAAFCVKTDVPLARGVWLLDWGTTLMFIGGLAAGRRWIAEGGRPGQLLRPRSSEDTRTPVLVAGAGTAGDGLLRAIRRDPKSRYRVVGFLSETKERRGITIGGLPVVGRVANACTLAGRMDVNEIVLTAGDLSGPTVGQLVRDAKDANLKVTVLPSFEQLLSGAVAMRPRDVQIEDLLGRDPVQLDGSRITGWLAGRTLVVTGSSGSIGSEVCRQLIPFNPARLVLLDQNESAQFFLERELNALVAARGGDTRIVTRIGDIRDATRMSALFREEKPEVLFHAAAYKHVPLMEQNPGEAVKVNVLGTKMLADLAHQHGLESFVMVSTDKAVNPTSLMGATKRVAELYVQNLAEKSTTRFVTVRFGNVLGSNGSVVPIFKQQIAAGGPVTVTHPDMVRYFMTIPEAAQLIIQAGQQGSGGDVFVLDMGKPVKIVDLARDLIRLSGLVEGQDVEIQFTGTRPGEKLYEELYLDGEERVPTSHPKILAADSDTLPLAVVKAAIDDLADRSELPLAHIEEVIAGLVPTFRKHTLPAGTRKAA